MKSYKSAFELLTDDPAEVKLYQEKANLMNSIVDKISDMGINQSEAAKIMKVTQPRVSNLHQDRMSKFSLDLLLLMNERLNIHNGESNA